MVKPVQMSQIPTRPDARGAANPPPFQFSGEYDPGWARGLMSNPLFMSGLGMLSASMGNIASRGRSGGNPAGGIMQGLNMAAGQEARLRQNSLMEQLLRQQGVHGLPDRRRVGVIPGVWQLIQRLRE